MIVIVDAADLKLTNNMLFESMKVVTLQNGCNGKWGNRQILNFAFKMIVEKLITEFNLLSST